jgi:hypothetical protein
MDWDYNTFQEGDLLTLKAGSYEALKGAYEGRRMSLLSRLCREGTLLVVHVRPYKVLAGGRICPLSQYTLTTFFERV